MSEPCLDPVAFKKLLKGYIGPLKGLSSPFTELIGRYCTLFYVIYIIYIYIYRFSGAGGYRGETGAGGNRGGPGPGAGGLMDNPLIGLTNRTK